MLTQIYVLLYVLLIAAQTQGTIVSCTDVSVKRGEATTITCTFKQDKSQSCTGRFLIDRYNLSGPAPSNRVSILDCPVINCTAKCDLKVSAPVYEFHPKVDKDSVTLTLKISNASEEHEGIYRCQKVGDDDGKTCNLTLKATESVQTTPRQGTTAAPSGNGGAGLSTTPIALEIGNAQPEAQERGSKSSSDNVGVIVGGVLSVVVVAAVIVVVIRVVKWRRRQNTPPGAIENQQHPPNNSDTIDEAPHENESGNQNQTAELTPFLEDGTETKAEDNDSTTANEDPQSNTYASSSHQSSIENK